MVEVGLSLEGDLNNAATLMGSVKGKKRRSSTLATELDEDTDRISVEESDTSLPSLSFDEGSDDRFPSETSESAICALARTEVLKDANGCHETQFAPFVTETMLQAQTLEEAGNLDEAIETLLPLLDVVGFYNFFGTVQLKLGTLFWQRGSYETSLHHLDQALLELEMGEARDDEIGQACFAIGKTYLSLGKWSDAKTHFRHCLKLAVAEQKLFAKATHALGMVFETTGRLEKANRHYQQALAIQRSLEDTDADTAVTLISFGSLKEEVGDLALSLSCYTEAHRIYASMKPSYKTSVDIGVVLSCIGWVLYLQGQIDQSLLTCAKALKSLAALGQHRNVATVLLKVGIIHEKLCHHKQAGELCRKALRMQANLLGKQHLDVAVALSAVASLTDTHPSQAIQYLSKALKIRSDALGSKHTAVGQSYTQLRDLYRRIGKEDLARECQYRALEILE